MQSMYRELGPPLSVCVQLRRSGQPPHVRALRVVCFGGVRPLHGTLSDRAAPCALRCCQQSGKNMKLCSLFVLRRFFRMLDGILFYVIAIVTQYGRYFAVQYCVLLDYPAISTLTWVTACASIWILCIFIGQMGMIASETTTYEVTRKAQQRVPSTKILI